MTATTITQRKFDQDVEAARKAAAKGPVLITKRGQPAHVLLSYDDYRRITRIEPSIADLLAHPGSEHIDFEPPKLDLKLKVPDLS